MTDGHMLTDRLNTGFGVIVYNTVQWCSFTGGAAEADWRRPVEACVIKKIFVKILSNTLDAISYVDLLIDGVAQAPLQVAIPAGGGATYTATADVTVTDGQELNIRLNPAASTVGGITAYVGTVFGTEQTILRRLLVGAGL